MDVCFKTCNNFEIPFSQNHYSEHYTKTSIFKEKERVKKKKLTERWNDGRVGF